MADDYSPRVILMGTTGSGKTSFISRILGRDIGVGHNLESCTKEIREWEVSFGDDTLFLVDTPGFNDTEVPDAVLLKQLAKWLKEKALKEQAIAGIIYLHNISEPRLTGAAKLNLLTFMAVSGIQYSPRISLVTNHWSERSTRKYEQEVKREQQYKEEWWSELIRSKAQLFRLELTDNPPDDNPICPQRAKKILKHAAYGSLWDHTSMPKMQAEVVQQNKRIVDTEAGTVLTKEIEERLAEVSKKKVEARKSQDPDELRNLNDQSRQLKLDRARLRNNVMGIVRHGFLRLN